MSQSKVDSYLNDLQEHLQSQFAQFPVPRLTFKRQHNSVDVEIRAFFEESHSNGNFAGGFYILVEELPDGAVAPMVFILRCTPGYAAIALGHTLESLSQRYMTRYPSTLQSESYLLINEHDGSETWLIGEEGDLHFARNIVLSIVNKRDAANFMLTGKSPLTDSSTDDQIIH